MTASAGEYHESPTSRTPQQHRDCWAKLLTGAQEDLEAATEELEHAMGQVAFWTRVMEEDQLKAVRACSLGHARKQINKWNATLTNCNNDFEYSLKKVKRCMNGVRRWQMVLDTLLKHEADNDR